MCTKFAALGAPCLCWWALFVLWHHLHDSVCGFEWPVSVRKITCACISPEMAVVVHARQPTLHTRKCSYHCLCGRIFVLVALCLCCWALFVLRHHLHDSVCSFEWSVSVRKIARACISPAEMAVVVHARQPRMHKACACTVCGDYCGPYPSVTWAGWFCGAAAGETTSTAMQPTPVQGTGCAPLRASTEGKNITSANITPDVRRATRVTPVHRRVLQFLSRAAPPWPPLQRLLEPREAGQAEDNSDVAAYCCHLCFGHLFRKYHNLQK